jgi:hypothetical protein
LHFWQGASKKKEKKTRDKKTCTFGVDVRRCV